MREIRLKRGDAGSAIEQVLRRDGAPVDLTGASVRFLMAVDPGATPKASGPATVVDAAGGRVRYVFAAGDLDETGRFVAEWEVTWPGGVVETFPSDGWVRIRVLPDLG